ncbi:hypothetical protein DSM21852_04970 [Methylocystis bryophila]|nr:hypothetical protein DSM21852_04970 [Methylocystis bryophila]
MKNAKAKNSRAKAASLLAAPAAFLGAAISAASRLHETFVEAIEKVALSK